jgi:deoxyribodipyrimidine photolyase-related protein
MSNDAKQTIWIFGDQLNPDISSLHGQTPGDCRILMVESLQKIQSKNWHAQRQHVVISAMMHFAEELREKGFEVDYQLATSFQKGLEKHCQDNAVTEVSAMEPSSWKCREFLEKNGIQIIPNNQFVCSYSDFAEWSKSRKQLRLEDFYRWQRKRLGILMSDGGPEGGHWNFDSENREPPPKDGRDWPSLAKFPLDTTDEVVLSRLSDGWGKSPEGIWPVTRAQALVRLREFIDTGLPQFGIYEDAMLASEWKLSHSCLSSSLNLGLLHPREVLAAAEKAYSDGAAPLNSVEGFIRQILGWREYVWGLYWLWMPDYAESNFFGADQAVPPVFLGAAETNMRCVSSAVSHLRDYGYTHHIERLMIFGNLALTAGINPQAMTEWMSASFVDSSQWVMVPNVVGMALYADGGSMSTKPYASGGAYINRMSDSCQTCSFNPKKRVGEDACPFTTLYWDFLDRNREQLSSNHRLALQYGNLDRLNDVDQIRERAIEVRERLGIGDL